MLIPESNKELNFSVAFGLLGLGIIYIAKNRFMHYHSQAVSLKWDEIGKDMQLLILALMKTVGGGFIAVAVAIVLLQLKFYLEKISWIPLLILVMGLIIYLASIYAQIQVRRNTPGNPPITISFLGIVMLIAAYIFNILSL